MIFLDQDLGSYAIQEAVRQWYPGGVDVVPRLADDALYSWLAQRYCVLVTNNTSDFWMKVDAHPQHCIVCLDVNKANAQAVSDRLRIVLSLPPFNSKRKRRGKVIRASSTRALWYSRRSERTVVSLVFPVG